MNLPKNLQEESLPKILQESTLKGMIFPTNSSFSDIFQAKFSERFFLWSKEFFCPSQETIKSVQIVSMNWFSCSFEIISFSSLEKIFINKRDWLRKKETINLHRKYSHTPEYYKRKFISARLLVKAEVSSQLIRQVMKFSPTHFIQRNPVHTSIQKAWTSPKYRFSTLKDRSRASLVKSKLIKGLSI